ncbi:MAG TPA: hypothetical protein VME45_02365 [Stellaceae bacterium]|nr:hypothetical protein [Stellaceae bacterium]
MRAFGNAAVGFAGTIDNVPVAADQPAAMHLRRRVQRDRDVAGDAAHHLAPADDAGNRLLVHAVLQRDDIAAGCQILLDEPRRPFGVVGFDADKGDVDRRLLGELLRLGEVQRLAFDRERLRALMVGDADAVAVDRRDVLGPEIDEGDVFPGLRHMCAGIAADRAGTDHDDPLAHRFPPALILLGDRSAADPRFNHNRHYWEGALPDRQLRARQVRRYQRRCSKLGQQKTNGEEPDDARCGRHDSKGTWTRCRRARRVDRRQRGARASFDLLRFAALDRHRVEADHRGPRYGA